MDSSVSLSIHVLILSWNTVFHILSEVNRDLVNSVTAFGRGFESYQYPNHH